MDHDPGTVKLSPATKEPSRSTSAARMLRHRERRRRGVRFLGIELREREIEEALIRRGQLHADHRANSAAVRKACTGSSISISSKCRPGKRRTTRTTNPKCPANVPDQTGGDAQQAKRGASQGSL
jgi:hypothetical protein